MNERYLHDNIDKSREQEKHKSEATLRTAEKFITEKTPVARIDEEDFENIYGPDEIKKDKAEIEEAENKHEQNKTEESEFSKKYANVLEVIVSGPGEDNEWLGPETKIGRASKFDDYFNGTDIIVEFDHDTVLAIDLTYSKNWNELASKVSSLKEDIDSNELTELKYFESQFPTGKKGKLEKVPRVLVSVSFKDLKDATRSWNSLYDENAPESLKPAFKEILKNSPIQLEILQQASSQLGDFIEYAKKNGKDDLVEIFSNRLDKLKEISQSDKIQEIQDKLLEKGLVSKPDYKLNRTEEVENHIEREFFINQAN